MIFLVYERDFAGNRDTELGYFNAKDPREAITIALYTEFYTEGKKFVDGREIWADAIQVKSFVAGNHLNDPSSISLGDFELVYCPGKSIENCNGYVLRHKETELEMLAAKFKKSGMTVEEMKKFISYVDTVK